MPRLKHAALSAWMVVVGTCSLAAQDRITWLTDLQTARETAQHQQRLVLLHFWTESCVPCQKLERYVFNQPELIRAISSAYIPVKINARQSSQLADYYRITAVPTDIIVDPTGKEIYRTTSPQDPNRYIAMLDGVKAHNSVGLQVPTMNGVINDAAATPTATGGMPGPGAFTHDRAMNNPQATAPHATASTPAADPSPVQNPYANPLQQAVPQQPAPDVSPPYANSLQAGPGLLAGPQNATRDGSRWQLDTPASPDTAPAGATPRGSRQPNYAQPTNLAPQENGPPISASAPPADSRPWADNPALTRSAPAAAPRVASLAPQSAPQIPQPPSASQPNFALDGYCPVTLMEGSKWLKGDPRWGIQHRGRTYLFTSDDQRKRFWANPDYYAPVLAGYDAVRLIEEGQYLPGRREHGVFYRDRVYLFADEAALQRFGQQPDYYVSAAEQAQQNRTTR